MLTTSKLTGASSRRERGRQEMRSSILAAAGRLVQADGIDGLTIRAVAQAVGYSPGALYEYFDSKEAILTALYFGGTDGLGGFCDRAVTSLPEGAPAIDGIVALGHAYRAYALDHPDLYRLVFGGFKAPPEERPVHCEGEPDESGGFTTLIDIAAHGVAAGEFEDLPPEVIAITAWASVHGFVSLEVTGHIAGGEGPGVAPESPEAGRQIRDHLFEAHLRMTLYGLVKEKHRLPTGSA